MTRINLVDPRLLLDKHLGAEYRELPRVYGLVLAAHRRGLDPKDFAEFDRYVLGPGHVKFFYTRLNWLGFRHALVVQECFRRGRQVSHPHIPLDASLIPKRWYGEWTPTAEDIALSLSRINERGGLLHNQPEGN